MDEPFEVRRGDTATLLAQADALLAGQRDLVANAANLSALIYHTLADVNWAGFYFLKGDELVVGPFQGKPACVTIPLTRGVCGAAARTGQVQRVADVRAFPGHIACDADSRSELVVPLIADGRVRGVLDLDSPRPDRFGEEEEALARALAERFTRAVDWP